MSDTYYDDDTDFDGGPRALREAYEKLKKQLDAKDKELASEKEARAKAEKGLKSQSLTSILRDKGVKPQLAKWLEKDEVEATPEAVDAWLKENGEFFNVKPAVATEPEAQAETEDQDGMDNVPPELAAAIKASQQLDASGVSPSEVGLEQKLQSIDVKKDMSFEDLLAAVQAAGVEFN